MPAPYTRTRLDEVEDSAPKFGLDEFQEARFVRGELDAEETGLSLHRIKAGKRQPFGHRHERAEEVYVVLSGSGRMKLDDEIIELEPLDAVRVAPNVTRAFEAGAQGLEVLVFGPRREGDGETVPGWWSG
jgi:mannose-6-phosphate isomerase-like protein (cupin superfamily)